MGEGRNVGVEERWREERSGKETKKGAISFLFFSKK